jgi:hypothetical protein
LSLVYRESIVKKRGILSLGSNPEPKLNPGELFIYLNEDNESFQVEAHQTPVTNTFLAKNKIVKSIRMNAGPFYYQYNNDFYTSDTRKLVNITIQIQLRVEDGYKLYLSKVSDINAFLNNIIPSELSRLVSTYDISEVNLIQRQILSVDAFPSFASAIRNMGLAIEQYNAVVRKDETETIIDVESRLKDAGRGEDLKDTLHSHDINNINDQADILRIAQKLKSYRVMLKEIGNPDIAIRLVPPEDRELVKADWESQGLLQIETTQKPEIKETPFDY